MEGQRSIKKYIKTRTAFQRRINSAADAALRREIFRLARIRDILGIIVIIETIILGVMLFI